MGGRSKCSLNLAIYSTCTNPGRFIGYRGWYWKLLLRRTRSGKYEVEKRLIS